MVAWRSQFRKAKAWLMIYRGTTISPKTYGELPTLHRMYTHGYAKNIVHFIVVEVRR